MVYGFMTHSFLHSSEHRQMKKERAETTKQYEAERLVKGGEEVTVPVLCRCPQRPWPHELAVHRKLFYESHTRQGQPRMRWPWSLRWAPEMS